MRGLAAAAFALFALAPAPQTLAASLLAKDVQTLREKPVMKVVRLLQDMSAELQHDLEDDRQVHEAMDCWCKTNEKAKTKAIEDGEAAAAQLEASISESTAKIAQLKQKRKATQDELYENQQALSQATDLRMKANQAFHKEETDLMQAVSATKQAVAVLSKHHPELAQVRTAMRRLHEAQVPRLAQAALHKEQMEVLRSFLQSALQAPSESFLGIPGMQSYESQSGQVYGILQQMLEDFEHSLAEAQEAEKKAVADFEMLKSAKSEEIAVGQQTIVELDSSLAEFGEKAAQATKQLQDTREQLVLDRTFLANLQQQCEQADAEFESRMKSRTEEIAAVQDAIQILNSEESYKAFGATFSLLQIRASSRALEQEQRLRQQASAVLSSAAARAGAPKLAVLAMSAKLDNFEQVKAAIDKLVAELATQQKDEVAHRDWCVQELAANDRATAAAEDKKTGLQSKLADLEQTIKKLASEIEANTADVAELQLQMKRASENREGENADFQQTIIDQHVTREILKKALARLQQVYALAQHAQPGAPHIQTSGDKTDPGNGPARFNEYKQNAGGSRAVQLIDEIIADSDKTAAEAMRAEQDSQAAYENFMKDSNQSIMAKTKAIADMTGDKSKAEESLVLTKTDLKQTLVELENLSETSADLHKSCDFITKNFAARQSARSAEMEALGQAKAILSGMK